jgi:hypothetical protein
MEIIEDRTSQKRVKEELPQIHVPSIYMLKTKEEALVLAEEIKAEAPSLDVYIIMDIMKGVLHQKSEPVYNVFIKLPDSSFHFEVGNSEVLREWKKLMASFED